MADITNKWNSENPWLGLGSYSEGQKLYGRDREIEALTEIIFNHPAIILYGKSGIGKSSLLKAGVFPQLRQNAMVPIYIRLEHNTETSYAQQIENAICEILNVHDTLSSTVPDLGLWDFMHRNQFLDSNGNTATPVIVLDQFEEIFTLTNTDHKREIQDLFTELADVLNNIKPDRVIQAEASFNKTVKTNTQIAPSRGFVIQAPSKETTFNYNPSPSFRFIFSIRDDSLYLLERNCAKIPALKVNRFNLIALDEANAMDVITKPAPGLFSNEESHEILDGLANYEFDNFRVVDPAILSLFLYSYFREQGKISYETIFEQYYQENTHPKLIKESSITYIEDNLLTERGNRNQVPLDDIYAAGVSIDEMQQLFKSKILKTENRKGTKYVEFSHDRLCDPAMKHRQERKSREQARKMRRRLLFIALGIASALGVFLYWQNSQYKSLLKSNEELNKRIALSRENTLIKDLNLELTVQRDSLHKLNNDLGIQSDSIRKSDEQNKMLNNALLHQQEELKRTLQLIQNQRDSISRLYDLTNKQKQELINKDRIISQYGICYACGGTGFTENGQICTLCDGSGHISNSEVISGKSNTIIQLRKVHPKSK